MTKPKIKETYICLFSTFILVAFLVGTIIFCLRDSGGNWNPRAENNKYYDLVPRNTFYEEKGRNDERNNINSGLVHKTYPRHSKYKDLRLKTSLQRFGKKSHFTKDFKIILFWSDPTYFVWQEEGQELFIKNNCPISKCYVTKHKDFFGGNLNNFDALIFISKHLKKDQMPTEYPLETYPHQKYIYLSIDSPNYYPECTTEFDEFFNWTLTYRLNSDCQLRYFSILDVNGKVVGPKQDMHWVNVTNEIDKEIIEKIKTKKKAAAWFVSKCKTLSHRENVVKNLQEELKKYELNIDVYGECGNLVCHNLTEHVGNCAQVFETEYFFYLAFEDSFDEDYVTESVLYALNNTVVPIVYGGANYSRFLPPRSYLDARVMPVEELAQTMNYLIKNPQLYAEYFWWRSYYRYRDEYNTGFGEASCELCALLHNQTELNNHSSYEDFRNWWNPQYENHGQCKISFY